MRLTHEDLRRIADHLLEKWGHKPCPMCGAVAWQVNPTVLEVREFNNGSLVLGGPLMPVVPVFCRNCGNSLFLNAMIIGVVPPSESSQPSEPSPEATPQASEASHNG